MLVLGICSASARLPLTCREHVPNAGNFFGVPRRAEYRNQRLVHYRNYENLDEETRSEDGRTVSSLQHEVAQHKVNYSRRSLYYEFEANERLVPSVCTQ